MSVVLSDADDCYELAIKLKEQLGDKIDFYDNMNTPLLRGKFLSLYRRRHPENFHNSNFLQFYFKFNKNDFLRISVGSYSSDISYGETFAALSDFYEVLSEEYGEPTVFFTTKEDGDGFLNLQWSFANKDEEIAKFKNDTYFNDCEIDTLIVLGQKIKDASGCCLTDRKKKIIYSRVGLPFELLDLASYDTDNFVKHKTGQEIIIPESANADGYSVIPFEKKLEKK